MRDIKTVVMEMNKKEMIKVYAAIAGQIKDDLDKAYNKKQKAEGMLVAIIRNDPENNEDFAFYTKQSLKATKEIEDCEKALAEWKPIVEELFALNI